MANAVTIVALTPRIAGLAVTLGAMAIVNHASAQNLIANHSFESGFLSPWIVDGPAPGSVVLGSVSSFTGHDGVFLFEASTGPNGSLTAMISGIAAGTSLELSFDCASVGTAGTVGIGEVAPFIGFLNNIGSIALSPVNGNEMVRYTFAFTAGEIEGIGLEWNALSGGFVAFDNFSLTVVPAPGAVALLGLAGLSGRRRRA